MEKYKLIAEIISFPVNSVLDNVSISSFLKNLNYLENRNDISEKDIAEVLSGYPEYIHGWWVWSDDKRTDRGWHLTLRDGDNVVDYYPPRPDLPKMRYTDKIAACAAFIKREIDSVVIGI